MEQLKHECGVALIRLLKPLDYYEKEYGTWLYALNKLYLLMEKQHNRGQEGAGVAAVKLNAVPGEEYMFRERALGTGAIMEIFGNIQENFKNLTKEQLHDVDYVRRNVPYASELYMGHLRYSTTGKSGLSYVHPVLRRNNWRAKSLSICGNFNMTNVDEIFSRITANGQHPRNGGDTYIILEQMGHRLDREVERLFNQAEAEGLTGMDITKYIEDHVDLANVLRSSSRDWDGGYVISGVTGSGESFTIRDPWGIRPAYWYSDGEIVVVASERPVIQTAFNVPVEEVKEIQPGQAVIVNRAGKIRVVQINKPKEKKACSFERIYFSRGSDVDIYKERKLLGKKLVPHILKAVNNDIDHTVFSFIPNTAEVAFYGMLQGLDECLNQEKIREIAALGHMPNMDELDVILSRRIRSEKVAIKDIKLRTFIAEGNSRNDLAAHVYDITYGSLVSGVDNLVIIDDSIVRGTTLKQSIIGILDRLGPKKIVIVSSSPQVRYPDYYGIDMSRLSEFIAFKAAIELLKERDMKDIIATAYRKSKEQLNLPKEQMINYVKEIYYPFTDEEISAKMV
ncbi:MAG: amidophosphoribosyltransferase, partial [Bacteroidaceae bacterium]|nr:amidophosphoribosyltransferase [Bacteroidaceae bacterium]